MFMRSARHPTQLMKRTGYYMVSAALVVAYISLNCFVDVAQLVCHF